MLSALAYVKLKKWNRAIEDSDAVLRVEKGNLKALLRRALARKEKKVSGRAAAAEAEAEAAEAAAEAEAEAAEAESRSGLLLPTLPSKPGQNILFVFLFKLSIIDDTIYDKRSSHLSRHLFV